MTEYKTTIMAEKGCITFPNVSTLSMYGLDEDCEAIYKAMSFPCGDNFLRSVLPLAGLSVGYVVKNTEDISYIELILTPSTSSMISTKIDPVILKQCDLIKLNTENMYYEDEEGADNLLSALKRGLYIGEDFKQIFKRSHNPEIKTADVSKSVKKVFFDGEKTGYIFNVDIFSETGNSPQFLIRYNDRYIFNPNAIHQYNIQYEDSSEEEYGPKIKPRSINKIMID